MMWLALQGERINGRVLRSMRQAIWDEQWVYQ